ncbi:MAG: hypothetical protein ACXQS1_00635 [Methermicoccaceae archaeon]
MNDKQLHFRGEFYIELLEINGRPYEHIGFRSEDGSFERMMSSLPETHDLPLKAEITVRLAER